MTQRETKTIGIYKITNPNGKIYIGQSVCIENRFSRYKRGNCKGQSAIYSSIVKYGFENHVFEIIETFANCDNIKDILNDREIYYITLYNSISPNGLNLKEGGLSGTHTKETREKLRMANSGKKQSPEVVAKRIANMIGVPRNDEVKRMISIKNTGKVRTKENIELLIASHAGQATPVDQFSKDGEYIYSYQSLRDAHRATGAHCCAIMKVCRGDKNYKTAAGFIWKYKNIGENNYEQSITE